MVPPWLPPTTSRTPCDSSQLPSSTVQITLASFHSAMSIVSPTWSLWAWVSRIVLGLSDFGSTEVTGLSSMNGSMATTVPASSSSRNAECPIQVSFGIDSLRGNGVFAAGLPHEVSIVRGRRGGQGRGDASLGERTKTLLASSTGPLAASRLSECCLKRHHWVVEVMRLIAKAGEALMLVKGGGRIIDGMDHGDRYAQSFPDNLNSPER